MYFGMTDKSCNCNFGLEYYILKEANDEFGDRVIPLVTQGIEYCDEIITCRDGDKPFNDIGVFKILHHYLRDNDKIDEVINDAKSMKEKLEKFLQDYKAGNPNLSVADVRKLQKSMNDSSKFFLSFAHHQMKRREQLHGELRRL